MAEVLFREQLKRLTPYKYCANGSSLLEPHLQIFWQWLIEQIPLWWAPNAITLLGLMCNVFTTFILIVYSPDARQEITLTGLTMLIFPVVMSLGASVLAGQAYFKIIFVQGGVGRHGSTVAGNSVLTPLLPISGLIFLAFIIWQNSPTHVYELHPVLYIMSFGMASAKITNKLVVAHVTKSEMGFWDRAFIGPLMLFLNQYFGSGDITPISEYFVLWICFFYCTADLSLYFCLVCMQMCDHLDIYCFKISLTSKTNTTDSANGKSSLSASLSSSSTS